MNANDSSDASHTLPDSWDTPKVSVLRGCGRRRGVRQLLHTSKEMQGLRGLSMGLSSVRARWPRIVFGARWEGLATAHMQSPQEGLQGAGV